MGPAAARSDWKCCGPARRRQSRPARMTLPPRTVNEPRRKLNGPSYHSRRPRAHEFLAPAGVSTLRRRPGSRIVTTRPGPRPASLPASPVEGELAGTVAAGLLDREDEAAATEVFVSTLPEVPSDSPAWNYPAVYVDRESILEAAGGHPDDEDRSIPPQAIVVPPELDPDDALLTETMPLALRESAAALRQPTSATTTPSPTNVAWPSPEASPRRGERIRPRIASSSDDSRPTSDGGTPTIPRTGPRPDRSSARPVRPDPAAGRVPRLILPCNHARSHDPLFHSGAIDGSPRQTHRGAPYRCPLIFVRALSARPIRCLHHSWCRAAALSQDRGSERVFRGQFPPVCVQSWV